MTIVCLGDSLTEGDYGVPGKRGIANVQKENYPYFLGKYLQAEVRNFGKCGYRSSRYLQYYREGNVDLSHADVIVIMLGTNGGQSKTEETPDNLGYRSLIKACQADAPKAAIVLCTPPHTTSDPAYSNFGYAEQVAEAARFVRKVAKEMDIPWIDVAKCPYFTAETEHIMQPNDGLHFGKEGYQMLAKYIGDGLKTMFHL